MMDPVAMAMAACLCARLHSISRSTQVAVSALQPENLPSMIELESSIIDLFAEQTPTGLWPKYFPLFHYNEAGSNFCYTFELLEAVLLEFGGKDNHILFDEAVIVGLERAVAACEVDRLESIGPEYGNGTLIPYNGWNSGGTLDSLRRGQPESWATAVVHMYLSELVNVLSRHIQQRLLKQYEAKTFDSKAKGLSGLLDITVHLDKKEASLRNTLQKNLVNSFAGFEGEDADNLLRAPIEKKSLSALLFGPPGTSKTEVAKALAAELKWPLVEIDPSSFLRNTFQNLYVEAEKIFKDAMDMYGVVVLFDELDALVQKRDGTGELDTESKFLTTYMLPKLLKLHDQGRLIFLMATNFQENFDDAIKRAGRFDLLLCMGPPTLEEKCGALGLFLGKGKQTASGGALLLEYANKFANCYDQLSLYTFGEFKSFVRSIGGPDDFEDNLRKLRSTGLRSKVLSDSETVGIKLKDLRILNDRKYSRTWAPGNWTRLQDLYSASFNEESIRKIQPNPTPAVRYVIERRKSKLQP